MPRTFLQEQCGLLVSSIIIGRLANAYEWRLPGQVACRMHMRTSIDNATFCCLHELQSDKSPPLISLVLPRFSTSYINFSNSLIFKPCTTLWLCFILRSEKLFVEKKNWIDICCGLYPNHALLVSSNRLALRPSTNYIRFHHAGREATSPEEMELWPTRQGLGSARNS